MDVFDGCDYDLLDVMDLWGCTPPAAESAAAVDGVDLDGSSDS